jgi:AI-2 transport protein TqsA
MISSTEPVEPYRLPSHMFRVLEGTACLVIVMWWTKIASHIVGLILLGMLLAFSSLPMPEWLMKRFKFAKNAAIGLTVALVGTVSVVTVFLVYETILRLREKLPVYHEHFVSLTGKILVFLNGHSINLTSLASANVSTSDRVLELSRVIIPVAGRVLADGLLICVLGLIFLTELVERAETKRGQIGSKIYYYGSDAGRYIAVSAKTGAITAFANLILLVVLGVDFPVLWSVLYFFLRFIPNVGVIIALVPPTFLALLMFGWPRALLVAGGLILTNMVADFVLNPMFLKKAVDVSFLEITLSLLFWPFLLGPIGAVLAIPLTLSLKMFIVKQIKQEKPVIAAA